MRTRRLAFGPLVGFSRLGVLLGDQPLDALGEHPGPVLTGVGPAPARNRYRSCLRASAVDRYRIHVCCHWYRCWTPSSITMTAPNTPMSTGGMARAGHHGHRSGDQQLGHLQPLVRTLRGRALALIPSRVGPPAGPTRARSHPPAGPASGRCLGDAIRLSLDVHIAPALNDIRRLVVMAGLSSRLATAVSSPGEVKPLGCSYVSRAACRAGFPTRVLWTSRAM